MRKINKDLNQIPPSLSLPNPAGLPRTAYTTHLRRQALINAGRYIDEAIYNERYKQDDTKEALKLLYKCKCAFCEQWVMQSHVEHYRPKNTYYWLAYSWDNLLLACPTCNQLKGDRFEILGTLATYGNTPAELLRIHSSSENYNLTEFPRLFNPEFNEPKGLIRFSLDGTIESNNDSINHTIGRCRLNSDDLKDQRRKLLNKFADNIRAVLETYENVNDQKIGIDTLVREFKADAYDLSMPFTGFRQFAFENKFLNMLIKSLKD